MDWRQHRKCELPRRRKSLGVVYQEQSAIHVATVISHPHISEIMTPSGLRKIKSIVFNDFVPIVLNEQTSLTLLGRKHKLF